MKSRKIAFTVFAGFTLIIFVYFLCCALFLIDDSYTIMSGGNINFLLPPGISAHDSLVEAAGNGSKYKSKEKVKLKALNLFPVGEISVNTVPATMLYPSGECVGIMMYSEGLVVSALTDFDTEDGVCVSPAGVAGIEIGDVIVGINGTKTSSVGEFVSICDSAKGLCSLDVVRGGKKLKFTLNPEKCTDGHNRMGIYVKNSVAGVGTMTYVSEDGRSFGALGHGISDSGTIVPLSSACVYRADIIDVKKGEKGAPGEIIGTIDEREIIGNGTDNALGGVYGVAQGYVPKNPLFPAAPSDEIKKGDAKIVCTVGADDKTEVFDVKIISINRLRQNKTKSFAIEVTDKRLIEKTGGIVQGMSGSPIVQNGKLIGAVTHVFVNDPTRGYGIFIENMLAEAEKLNKGNARL